MKPLVGIVCAFNGKSRRDCEWDNYNHVEETYIQKIKNADAIPLLIPVRPSLEEDIPMIMKKLDGILFTGGMDLHPSFYGEEPTIGLGEFDVVRDNLEITLAKYCITNDIPVFGICRGMQVLNVAAGGNLYQDIYTQTDTDIQHIQRTLENFATHHIKLEKKTFLHKIFGDRGFVNSHHHQGVRNLGENFEVIAWSEDGLMEAMMHKNKKIIAVQWHPELMNTKEAQDLFKYFIECIRNGKE
ncbi:MAG: gamma-glutamyl-gamma-aminobutyrate hydrolase family protein [Eubacteriales bacterium]